MSQKILLITQEPNKEANKNCVKHADLFDLEKNAFSQFFGRLIFGDEEKYRGRFKPEYIHWMHAIKGLDKAQDEDGKEAIKIAIKKDSYEVIITYGTHALNVLLDRYKYLREIMEQMKGAPVPLCDINKTEFNEIKYSNCFSLPHPSGQAQGYWIDHASEISDVIKALQKKISELELKSI